MSDTEQTLANIIHLQSFHDLGKRKLLEIVENEFKKPHDFFRYPSGSIFCQNCGASEYSKTSCGNGKEN